MCLLLVGEGGAAAAGLCVDSSMYLAGSHGSQRVDEGDTRVLVLHLLQVAHALLHQGRNNLQRRGATWRCQQPTKRRRSHNHHGTSTHAPSDAGFVVCRQCECKRLVSQSCELPSTASSCVLQSWKCPSCRHPVTTTTTTTRSLMR